MSALALPPLRFPLACADELHRLHEHARGAAAGIVHAAAVGFEHLDQELDDAARRVELAALLAFGARELREEILVDAAEHVLGAACLVADLDIADEVNQLAEPLLVERWAGIVLGQHTLERRVVALDASHRVVYELADGWLAGLRLQVRPACFGRYPENVLRAVFVGVLRVRTARLLRYELRVLLLERVGDVLHEDQAEDDVLVFCGVHAAAKRIGHLP